MTPLLVFLLLELPLLLQLLLLHVSLLLLHVPLPHFDPDPNVNVVHLLTDERTMGIVL